MVKRHTDRLYETLINLSNIRFERFSLFSAILSALVINRDWYITMESNLTSEINNMFTPRAYQIDLYERAVENNMILYLPTGTGKTYIAVMLLKHLSAAVRKYVHSCLWKCFSDFTWQESFFEPRNTYLYRHFNDFKSFFYIFRPYEEGGKRSIFIVNTVALVEQQSAYISRHTDLTCKGYSGDMMVDFWQEQQWITELEQQQVLICCIVNSNFGLE